MKYGKQMVPINLLRYEGWLATEMRVRLNKKKVEQYAKEKDAHAGFPLPEVFYDKDEIFRVGDGFHRIEADFRRGLTVIEVVVRDGGIKEAILWNLRANKESQGLPFSVGDLSKAAKALLLDEAFAGWSRTQIANAVGCSKGTVSRVAFKCGLPTMAKNSPVRNAIEKLLADGEVSDWPAAKIAEKAGCSRSFAQMVLSTRRPPVRNPVNLSNDAKVAEMLRQGATQQKIVSALRVSIKTVRRVRKGEGYTPCPHCNGTGKILREAVNGVEANGGLINSKPG